MEKFCFDIWFQIFSYLTPRIQTRLSKTNKLLYTVYMFRKENHIYEDIHGLYEVIDWKAVIYRFKVTVDKKYVWIKNGDVMEKRELLRDCDGYYYCKGVNYSSYLDKCNLDKVEELLMNYCDYCDYLDYCTLISKAYLSLHEINRCDICKKKEVHLHNICGKCYELKYSKTLGFCRTIIFVD